MAPNGLKQVQAAERAGIHTEQALGNGSNTVSTKRGSSTAKPPGRGFLAAVDIPHNLAEAEPGHPPSSVKKNSSLPSGWRGRGRGSDSGTRPEVLISPRDRNWGIQNPELFPFHSVLVFCSPGSGIQSVSLLSHDNSISRFFFFFYVQKLLLLIPSQPGVTVLPP